MKAKGNKITKGNMKRLLGYYKPYKRDFLIDMFFAFSSAGVAITIPLFVRYVMENAKTSSPDEFVGILVKVALIMVVLVAYQWYSNYYIANYGHVMGAKMEYDMRQELFSHYQKLSFSFYDEEKVGSLMSRITSDLFDITELLHHGPENLIISIIRIVGAFAILLTVSVKLSIVAFLLVPFMAVFAYFYNKKMKAAFARNRVEIASINGQIEDNLSGIRVVKSFANEEVEREKFKVGNNGFLDAKKNSYHYMGGYHSGLNAFTNLINILVIVVGGFLIVNNKLNATDYVTFLLYIYIFTDPIRVLIDFTESFQNGYSGFVRFLEILDIKPDIVDKEDAKEIEDVKGNIVFEDVSFRYNDNAHRVLRHINLDIKAGQYVAIVGTSGVGKSTLCNLIPRFYEVSNGSIKIDNTDIRDIKVNSLRDNIGVVEQNVYLFAGTIFENIAYGKKGATKEEVIRAAKNANAHDFIMSLENGYDTDIGQRGIKLSGGQKQRISIARVFLKNPPILIFDEATSALDNESEKVVQESLETLAKDRTTLVIAHRLSTIRNAENILVLTDEGVKEQGTHEELLELNGVYKSLYSANL